MSRRGALILAALLAATVSAGGGAETPSAPPPRIALIIDDLGDSLAEGRRAVQLPGPVACAFLPHTPHARALAEQAHRGRKEILLHLPMEPATAHDPGPGRLDADMPALEIDRTLDYDLASVPHVIGVNNHMGSRLTAQPQAMEGLMLALKQRGGLYFVDSLTTPESHAAETARRHGVPTLTRDVFLDRERRPDAIARQWNELLRIAQRRGFAVGIAHPYPETLALLEQRLARLTATGVQLVAPSTLLPKSLKEGSSWPASSSR
jgi:polysaccharide deacetylase 2 family uncharacterized protein YibQ